LSISQDVKGSGHVRTHFSRNSPQRCAREPRGYMSATCLVPGVNWSFWSPVVVSLVCSINQIADNSNINIVNYPLEANRCWFWLKKNWIHFLVYFALSHLLYCSCIRNNGTSCDFVVSKIDNVIMINKKKSLSFTVSCLKTLIQNKNTPRGSWGNLTLEFTFEFHFPLQAYFPSKWRQGVRWLRETQQSKMAFYLTK